MFFLAFFINLYTYVSYILLVTINNQIYFFVASLLKYTYLRSTMYFKRAVKEGCVVVNFIAMSSVWNIPARNFYITHVV